MKIFRHLEESKMNSDQNHFFFYEYLLNQEEFPANNDIKKPYR